VKRNVLIVGTVNKHTYDKTTWYRVDYEALNKQTQARVYVDGGLYFPETSSSEENLFPESQENTSSPIPETYPQTTETSYKQKFGNFCGKNIELTVHENGEGEEDIEEVPDKEEDYAISQSVILCDSD
jgi:hypothetical protein